MNKKKVIEVAVESLDQAKIAQQLGADRIELCASLDQGGLTPSCGMVKACVENLSIPIHVMIRCRPGLFNYNDDEYKSMMYDVEAFADLGVDGIVFGFLNDGDEVDLEKTEKIVKRCKQLGLNTTFHRAIDVCKNKDEAIQYLIKLGVDNVLTSGGEKKAMDGLTQIQRHLKRGGINVLVGGGVRAENVSVLIQAGVLNIHLSGVVNAKKNQGDKLDFGRTALFDTERVSAVIENVRNEN